MRTPLSSSSSPTFEEEVCCYCLEGDTRERGRPIHPCSCTAPVHRSCLNEFHRLNEDRAHAFYRCERCLTEYELVPVGGTWRSRFVVARAYASLVFELAWRAAVVIAVCAIAEFLGFHFMRAVDNDFATCVPGCAGYDDRDAHPSACVCPPMRTVAFWWTSERAAYSLLGTLLIMAIVGLFGLCCARGCAPTPPPPVNSYSGNTVNGVYYGGNGGGSDCCVYCDCPRASTAPGSECKCCDGDTNGDCAVVLVVIVLAVLVFLAVVGVVYGAGFAFAWSSAVWRREYERAMLRFGATRYEVADVTQRTRPSTRAPPLETRRGVPLEYERAPRPNPVASRCEA